MNSNAANVNQTSVMEDWQTVQEELSAEIKRLRLKGRGFESQLQQNIFSLQNLSQLIFIAHQFQMTEESFGQSCVGPYGSVNVLQ